MLSKSMSTPPLCSKTVSFYIPPGKIRYKIIQIRATAQNPCIFYGQKACGCRHSAVIRSVSIPSPTKHGTKLAKSVPPHRIQCFLRSKCIVISPLCGRFHNFYTVSHKTRYKVRLIRATTQNPASFAFKMNDEVTTLRPFPHFLYRLPQNTVYS